MSLHDELHGIADRAPTTRVDPDAAWREGRAEHRQHRRRTTGAVLAAAAAVALVAGLVTWLPDRGEAPVASTGASGLGVPDQLYAVPERFTARGDGGEGWARDEVSRDLAVGRGALAFVTPEGLPVVVDAAEGGYHLLDLPDAVRPVAGAPRDPTVSLSPDGRSLAYGWADPDTATDDGPVPSGVRIVDLQTGTVRTVEVDAARGARALRFSWSPGSSWLVWTGRQLEGTTPTAGVIGVDAGVYRALDRPIEGYAGQSVAVVDDQGVVDLAGRTAPPETRALAADGTLARAATRGDGVDFVTEGGRTTTASIADATGGAVPLDVVGWVGDDAAVVLTGETGDFRDPSLVLVGPDVAAREVATLEEAPASLSLATDLMSLEQPTVERPEPDWPWSTARWVWTGIGIALVLAVLGMIVVSQRRRRHGAGTQHPDARPPHGAAWSVHGGGGGNLPPGGGF